VAATIFCSNLGPDSDLVSCNIWPFQLYSITHDMLKNWPTPLLGPRAHCSYGRLLVELGCSTVSVSESDQEALFTNQIAVSFYSLKQFYLTSNPSSKLYSWTHRWIWAFESLDFDIRSSRYSCLNIWRESREFCREQDSDPSCTKNSAFITILLVFILRLYSQSYRDARHLSVFESNQETIFFTNQIAARFCSVKRFYLTSNPSWKL